MTNDTSRGDRFLDPGEIAEGKFDGRAARRQDS
jgi:hypothetical protein